MLCYVFAFPFLPYVPRFFLIAAGVAVFLSGCGFVRHEPREAWRGEAEAMCMRSGLVKTGVHIRPMKPIDGPGPCGTDLPLRVGAFENDQEGDSAAAKGGKIKRLELTVLKPEATMGCPMVAWMDDWVARSLQPAAMAWFGQNIKEIRTGSYACRRRNHQANAKLSEHSFGNAVDIMAFELADGRVITVQHGWKTGSEIERGFLRDVLYGACQRFKTVLGPGADVFHYDHFHFDLARHDARGVKRYCKPIVEAPKRPQPGENQSAPSWGGAA